MKNAAIRLAGWILVAGYACLVPFVEDDETIFLKTIIPSRKMTKHYLGGD